MNEKSFCFLSSKVEFGEVPPRGMGLIAREPIDQGELVLVPLPNLVIGSSIGWNVAEYDDFPNGEQTAAQRWFKTGGQPIICGGLTPLPPGTCTQDLKGERLDSARLR